MSELSNWLERPIEEDWEDVENILQYYGVSPVMEYLKLAWEYKKERYAGVFGERTRLLADVPGRLEIPGSYGDLYSRFWRVRSEIGLSEDAYYKAIQPVKDYTCEEIARNRTADGKKLLRLVLKEIPEDIRAAAEVLWSKVISSYKHGAATLVWSISPLDILLQAMAGITSCHNLVDGGCKGGPVAYMTDSPTSILYVTNSLRRFVNLDNIPVPEKKWRALCMYKEGIGICVQREYPYQIESYADAANRLILEHTENWAYLEETPYLYWGSEAAYRDGESFGHSACKAAVIDDIAVGVCPECGDDMDNGNALVCSRCDATTICCDCGSKIPDDEVIIVADKPYCQTCYELEFTECSNCGEPLRDADVIEVDGEPYCETCYDAKFASCDECGEPYPYWTLHDVGSCHYCDDCFEYLFCVCYRCGEIIRKDLAIIEDGEPYCQDCHDACFVTCDGCGETVKKSQAKPSAGTELYYCAECQDRFGFQQCEECGREAAFADLYIFHPTDSELYWLRVCGDCYDRLARETISECAKCGKEAPIAELHQWVLNYPNPHERFCRECLEELAEARRKQLAH